MDKNGIDGLLKIVDPKLIARYEEKNLDGKTLQGIYEEYKVVSAKRAKMLPNWYWCATLGFMVVAAVSAIAVWHFMGSVMLAVALLVVALILFHFLLSSLMNKIWECNRTISQCKEVFNDFRQSVEALNPIETAGQMPHPTSDSAWGTLYLLAVRVLEAKSEFLAECKSENPRMDRVQKIIAWEQDCRRRFNIVFVATTKFGLGFSKERIYQAAQDEIDSRD